MHFLKIVAVKRCAFFNTLSSMNQHLIEMNDKMSNSEYMMKEMKGRQEWMMKAISKYLEWCSMVFSGRRMYISAVRCTESFAIMKDNTAFGRMENEISISDTKANIRNWNIKETAMGMNRKRNIDLEEARPVIGSGADSNPAGNNCGKKERQALWNLIPIMMMLLNVASASATQSINLVPPEDYTVFQNDTPAIFYCYGNGVVVAWIINGTAYNTGHEQRGIIVVSAPTNGTTVSSRLMVPSNSTINNNTEVVCKTIDVTVPSILTSAPANLTIQGTLDAPTNFSVKISNTSNTTFLLSWGAPFTLDVTDSPDILNYTLCTIITIYGCRTISSDPDCTFPRTCTSSVDFTDPSLNGTNGGQNKTIMDSIDFTLFAVNGAGNGSKAKFPYLVKKESGENLAPSPTEPRSINVFSTTTILTNNGKGEIPIAPLVAGVVSGGILIAVVIIISLIVIAIKCFRTKRKLSDCHMELQVVAVGLYSYATHHEEPTLAATKQIQEISETSHYIDVACHPIISIPAPHQKVVYSEVKPHNEKPKSETSCYIDVECHPIISIPAPHDEVQYSETITTRRTAHSPRVECDSEDNGNETAPGWCKSSDPEEQVTAAQIAPGINLVGNVSEGKPDKNRVLSENIEHPQTNYSDSFGIKLFEADYHSCEDVTCNESIFFAFVSTITPQFTELTPTVLVQEESQTLWKEFRTLRLRSSELRSEELRMIPEVNCTLDNPTIFKDDQNYTDGTENMQNDWSNMMEGQIIVKFTTAFVENGPPWMASIIQNITELAAAVKIIILKRMLLFKINHEGLICAAYYVQAHYTGGLQRSVLKSLSYKSEKYQWLGEMLTGSGYIKDVLCLSLLFVQ